jgi:hypothetical protein
LPAFKPPRCDQAFQLNTPSLTRSLLRDPHTHARAAGARGVQRLYLLSYTHTLTLSNTHTLSLFSHSLTLSLSLCSEVRRQTCDLITLMDLGAASSQYYMFMEDDFRVYAPHRHPNPRASVSSSRASPPHRPREDGLDHPADTSITHLAAALALLSRWRLSKPERTVNKSSRASLQTGIGTLRLVSIAGWEGPPLWSILSERSFKFGIS